MNELISREELLETIRSMTVTMGGRELFLPSLKDAVIDAISVAPAVSPTDWIEWYTDEINKEFHYRIVREDPVVDAVPVRYGRWEWDTEDFYMCSSCGEKSHVKEVMCKPDWAFCPNCGAEMYVCN